MRFLFSQNLQPQCHGSFQHHFFHNSSNPDVDGFLFNITKSSKGLFLPGVVDYMFSIKLTPRDSL
jgi:hypothetical protein